MTLNDHNKLIRAEFRLIRRQDNPEPHIRYKDGSVNDWHKLPEKFASKAARDRRMHELLENPGIVED